MHNQFVVDLKLTKKIKNETRKSIYRKLRPYSEHSYELVWLAASLKIM